MARTRGSVSSVSTASLSPLTTLSTPAGSPASTSNSASRMGTEGSRSDGLRMKALPQASAGANFHIGIMAGKLNGVMPATTPSGWRSENRSIPGPALSLNSPFSRCGMPHANSTTSSPRWMSPLESATVLPCSEDKSWARLSNSFCTSSRNLNRTRARRCGLVAAQAGCAASALAMACSTSDFLAKLTLACTSPVLGLNTSPLRPDVPATFLPPMKWPISRMGASLGRSARVGEPLFPVSDSAACAPREAGGVTTMKSGLGGDGTAVLIQKSADLVHEARPCRLVRQDDVVAAFERNEPGIGDAAREHQPLLERAGGVAAAVQHERRCGDPRQQMGDIDVAEHLQQAGRIRGRGLHALQIIDPLRLFERPAGDHERGKDLPKGGVVPPADPNELEQSLAPLDFGRISPRAPALRVASGKHEPRHALGMAHRVGYRDRGALGVAEQRETTKIERVGHRLEIAHERLE